MNYYRNALSRDLDAFQFLEGNPIVVNNIFIFHEEFQYHSSFNTMRVFMTNKIKPYLYPGTIRIRFNKHFLLDIKFHRKYISLEEIDSPTSAFAIKLYNEAHESRYSFDFSRYSFDFKESCMNQSMKFFRSFSFEDNNPTWESVGFYSSNKKETVFQMFAHYAPVTENHRGVHHFRCFELWLNQNYTQADGY